VLTVASAAIRRLYDVPPFTLLLSMCTASLLTLSGCFLLDDATAGNELLYLHHVLAWCTSWACVCRLPWLVSFLASIVSVTIPYFLFLQLHVGNIHMSAIVTIPILCAVFGWGLRNRESNIRLQFYNSFAAAAYARATEDELRLQNVLLMMILPHSVAAAFRSHRDLATSDVSEPCRDLAVAMLRADSLTDVINESAESPQSLLAQVDAARRAVDATIARYPSLDILSSSGDVIVIVGELIASMPVFARRLMPEVAKSDQIRLERSAMACADCISVAVDLRQKHNHTVQFSMIASIGGGFAMRLGTACRKFEIYGIIMQTVEALLDAAPAGFVGVTEPLKRMLVGAKVALPRYDGDASPMEPVSWRVRGVGQTSITPLCLQSGQAS
jgi:hypothetical protein